MSYSIKVLKNEEFDKLPFKHSSIALGVADPKTNTAYVRYSAHPELNKYLIDHEFEHLVEEIPTDEIEKIVKQVIKENQNAIADFKAGEKKALNFLIGQIMKLSNRRADFETAKKHLMKYLK